MSTPNFLNDKSVGKINSSYHTGVRVVQVVAGSKSSASSNDGYALALTDNGDVYSWGKGYNGRLGHKDSSNYNTPKLVEALVPENVTQVLCRKIICTSKTFSLS